MNKGEFLLILQDKLSGFSREEAEERLNFYSEMIEDRMEEGLSQEEAVAAIGTVEEIIEQIAADMPLSKGEIKEKKSKKRKNPGKPLGILLLVLGSPLWLLLLLAALTVLLAFSISLWAVSLSLWAVFLSLVACFLGSIVAAIVFALGSNKLAGIFVIGVGCVCAGCAVFWFLGCRAVTKGLAVLTKKMILWIKNFFIKREEQNV